MTSETDGTTGNLMYTLPLKGVMDNIHCSLLQSYSALYFREVEEGRVITQILSVEKHDAIIQRARSSKSKGDITSHFAKKKKTSKIKTRITEDNKTCTGDT